MSGTIRTFQLAPQWGPMAGFLRLAQGVVAAPTQGPWLPCGLFYQASVDVEGSFSTISASVRLANTLQPPLNGYLVTIGGTITVGDVVSLTVTGSASGAVTVSHTVATGDTVGAIAAALAASLQANAALAAAGFLVSENAAIITMLFPSLAPGLGWEGAGLASGVPATSPPVNYVTVATSVSGTGTETAAVALVNAGGSVQTITAAPWRTAVGSTLPGRWVQGSVTTLGGSGASVNLNFAGVA